MNATLAQVLLARLLPLQQNPVYGDAVLAGLVRSLSTDQLSGAGNETVSLPVPLQADARLADDWKLLLPDKKKPLIVYFEESAYSERIIGGLTQALSRLTMVVWYNASLLSLSGPLDREALTLSLLSSLPSRGRSIVSDRPEVAGMQLTGWSRNQTDPFLKYTAYKYLFDFKETPFGYLALDLSLTAYLSYACLPV